MKLCIVGIGGAGGKVTQKFLGNEDLDLALLTRITNAQYVSPGDIKGIWLEADKNDAKNIQHFFGDMNDGCYPCFFIPHDTIPDGSEVHVAVKNKYGYDLKKQGFVRDAQYLKAIFEIFDTDEEIQGIATRTVNKDMLLHLAENSNNNGTYFNQIPNPIFDSAWNAVRPFTTLGGGECDGILFVVSFGGGTGTGFINPIINHIRNEGKADYPVFVLGMLTELGDFADKAQFAKEGRRNLAAISAIYDLLTKSAGANGVIIIDNQILFNKFGANFDAANGFIHEIMQPIVAARDYPKETPPSQAIAQFFSRGLDKPAIFVPLFASMPKCQNSEEGLVRQALSEEGRLFNCTPEKADAAIVFCRGYVDTEKMRQAVYNQMGIPQDHVWPLRKMKEGKNEILILLRNPYGGDKEAYTREGSLEHRLCKVISLALQYIGQSPEDLFYEGKEKAKEGKEGQVRLTPISKEAVSKFFFGPEGFDAGEFGNTSGFAFELREARRRLRDGEKPFFLHQKRIFEKNTKKQEEKPTKEQDQNRDEIMRMIDNRVKEILDERGYKNLVQINSCEVANHNGS
jgi:hypothetical protein